MRYSRPQITFNNKGTHFNYKNVQSLSRLLIMSTLSSNADIRTISLAQEQQRSAGCADTEPVLHPSIHPYTHSPTPALQLPSSPRDGTRVRAGACGVTGWREFLELLVCVILHPRTVFHQVLSFGPQTAQREGKELLVYSFTAGPLSAACGRMISNTWSPGAAEKTKEDLSVSQPPSHPDGTGVSDVTPIHTPPIPLHPSPMLQLTPVFTLHQPPR